MTDRIAQIRSLLVGSGLGWLFPGGTENEDRAFGLAAEFDEAEAVYKARYNDNWKQKHGTDFDLLREASARPDEYRVFLQSIGLPMSAEVRVVILRLIDHEMIGNIKFDYQHGGKSRLRIRMLGEDDYIDAPYPFDVLILPQLSYFAVGDKLEIGPIKPWQMPDSSKEGGND